MPGLPGFQSWDFSRFVQDLQSTSQGTFLPMPNAPRLEMHQLQQQQLQQQHQQQMHQSQQQSTHQPPHMSLHQSHIPINQQSSSLHHHPPPPNHNNNPSSSSLFQNFPTSFPLQDDYDRHENSMENSFWRNRNM
jgi:hypothetical protein